MSKKPEEWSPEFIDRKALKRALAGDTKQARDNLTSIANAIESGQLDGHFKQWLILALRDIAAGKNANEILMLTGRSGKNPCAEDKRWLRDYEIYKALADLKSRKPNAGVSYLCDILSRQDFDYMTADAIRKAYRRIVDESESIEEIFPRK